jgi:hypothetical protein
MKKDGDKSAKRKINERRVNAFLLLIEKSGAN